MGYNVADIIEKAVNIAIKRKALYEDIEQENSDALSIKMISRILIKEVDRTIEYYKALSKEINDTEFEEIDFSIYDKMASLINDFNKRISIAKINNVREYLEYSLGFERSIYSLLMDIQGRFVKNTSDVHTKTYKILSDMINNKIKHIEILEKYFGG